MERLNIDIETRSIVDLAKSGAYKYAESEDFKILLFAYSADGGPVQVVDMGGGETLPPDIVEALRDPGVIKHAYNAAFEWYCLNRAGYETPIEQWQCTMIHGMYLGYPSGLSAIGAAIGLPEDKKKLTTGKALIRYFCTPAKATKANGGRAWNLPVHDPDKWALFKAYNAQDVVTESEILKRLSRFPVPCEIWAQWWDDVKMNALGVRVDANMTAAILRINAENVEVLTKEAASLTGLDNPNSPAQLLEWLRAKGLEAPDLKKDTVTKLLKGDLDGVTRRLLEIRRQLGKTSIKKYDAITAAKGADDRVRGLTQFYGANRTGRWAGRIVQMQNLPRNYMATLREARALAKTGNYAWLRLVYGNVADTLSQLIRTAFIPAEGHKFVVADFSAIEARVIAWLAGETWVNEVFASHGKIYEATASQMFHVPIEKIKKGNPEYELRQKGKVATLALGYQGGVNALIAMKALDMGIPEKELPDIVHRWRTANPNIVRLWFAVETAAVKTVETGQPQGTHGLILAVETDLLYGQSFLTIRLPSGRKLYYAKPYLAVNRFGKPAVHYWDVNQTTRKWEATSTYGGRLVENVVQAIARDCLAVTLKRIRDLGLSVVFHVHDEVIIDTPKDVKVDDICGLMAKPIEWASGLILKGAGFENDFYMKD